MSSKQRPPKQPSGGRSEYQDEFLSKNSALAEPVGRLLDLQLRYFDLDKQFKDEMWRLEQQHYARCRSLFQDRQSIIAGTAITSNYNNASPLYSAVAVGSHNRRSAAPAPAGKGSRVPHFWLRAMKNNPTVARWIHDRDEPALSYLRDVRVEFIDRGTRLKDAKDKDAAEVVVEDAGFRLVFEFDENPYFADAVLTKEFIYEREPPEDNMYGELLYSKALGCAIHWRPGQDLTDLYTNANGEIEFESFFDFFESTSFEDEDDDDEDDDENGSGGGSDDGSTSDNDQDDSDAGTDEEETIIPRPRARQLEQRGRARRGNDYYGGGQDSDDDSIEEIMREDSDGDDDDDDDDDEPTALESDFELGEEIKDALIPYAVHWYTGEALLFDDEDDDEDDEGDED